MYLAEKINKKFDAAELEQYIGQTVTCDHLRRILGKIVGGFGVRVLIIRDKNLIGKNYSIKISGEFDYYRKKNPATIYLHISPNRKNVRLSIKSLNRVVFLSYQTLMHELNHKEQNSKRPKISPVPLKIQYSNRLSKARIEDIHYYSEIDEIDSHAHDMALEAKYYYPDMSIRDIFRNVKKLRNLFVYRQYKKAFKGLNWTKLRQSLFKRVWKWFPKVIPPKKLLAST
jgi:hypothetical protein